MMSICLVAGMATGQESNGKPQRPNGEQMTKMKIKKMVKNLALDNKTADLFTETYTKYQEQVAKINEKYPPLNFPGMGPGDEPGRKGKDKKQELEMPLDEEVEKSIKDGFKRERELLDLKEKYFNAFIKFLTPQQIQKMYQMENTPRQRPQNGNMQRPMGGRPGGFPGGPGAGPGMGGMTPPPGMW